MDQDKSANLHQEQILELSPHIDDVVEDPSSPLIFRDNKSQHIEIGKPYLVGNCINIIPWRSVILSMDC